MGRRPALHSVLLSVLILITLFLAAGCKPEHDPAYNVGAMVKTKVGGYIGMVIRITFNQSGFSDDKDYTYHVRLNRPEMIPYTGTFAPDRQGRVAYLAIHKFRAYELEAYTPGKAEEVRREVSLKEGTVE